MLSKWSVVVVVLIIAVLFGVFIYIVPKVNDGGFIYLESDGGETLIIKSPKPGEEITSPLVVSGEARGSWFFEASFPLVLTNWDGLIIAQSYAEAKDDWMTTEFVPFEGVLKFEKPEYGENGFLILQKDNPSGLPEHDDAVEIPVLFK